MYALHKVQHTSMLLIAKLYIQDLDTNPGKLQDKYWLLLYASGNYVP